MRAYRLRHAAATAIVVVECNNNAFLPASHWTMPYYAYYYYCYCLLYDYLVHSIVASSCRPTSSLLFRQSLSLMVLLLLFQPHWANNMTRSICQDTCFGICWVNAIAHCLLLVSVSPGLLSRCVLTVILISSVLSRFFHCRRITSCFHVLDYSTVFCVDILD